MSKFVFTTSGQFDVREAHSADAIHILGMKDVHDDLAVGKALVRQMVKRVGGNDLFKRWGMALPLDLERFPKYDLDKLVGAVWSQSGFLPSLDGDMSLKSLGAAAKAHYKAQGKRSPALKNELGGMTAEVAGDFASALSELKQFSEHAETVLKVAENSSGLAANTALKDLVKLQSEMAKSIANLHEVVVNQVVPGWFKQVEETGRSAAVTIKLTVRGLAITIGVSVAVAVVQIVLDGFSGESSGRQQDRVIALLEKQLGEFEKLRSQVDVEGSDKVLNDFIIKSVDGSFRLEVKGLRFAGGVYGKSGSSN